jgi:hypothetical protein
LADGWFQCYGNAGAMSGTAAVPER